MLKTASKAFVTTTIFATRRLLGYIGGKTSTSPFSHTIYYAPTETASHFSEQEIRALVGPGTFEDYLISFLTLKTQSPQFTPLQTLLLFIMCSGMLKKYFGRQEKNVEDAQNLTEEEKVLKALLDLVNSEIEHIYNLTSARNALVSPDPL